MNFTPHYIEQRSTDWYQLRLGLLTGSCASAVIAERKRGAGELKARQTLRRRLVTERLTGLSADDVFQTDDMRRGSEMEPQAFAAYEAQTGLAVRRVGFIKHNDMAAGCSPDGYVGEWEGLIELKCPKSPTHLGYLLAGVVPDEYKGQCLHALWLTGAQWIDFVSFDPRFSAEMELFVVRLPRVEVDVAIYGRLVEEFLAECDTDERTARARWAA